MNWLLIPLRIECQASLGGTEPENPLPAGNPRPLYLVEMSDCWLRKVEYSDRWSDETRRNRKPIILNSIRVGPEKETGKSKN